MKKLLLTILLLYSAVMASKGQAQAGENAFKTDLNKIHDHIEAAIQSGKLPGAVVIVARDGKIIYHEASGYANIKEHVKVTDNTVFRLASMSKPITAAGILVLVDEGKLKLSDPLSKYLPEYKHMRVAVPDGKDYKPNPADTIPGIKYYHLVPADREITIKDILTHSCGVTQGGVGIAEFGKITRMPGETLARFIPRAASVPLDFQPGTRTGYTFILGFDLLGRVIEIASGQPLDKFLEKNIFKPCDMPHAGFPVKGTNCCKIPALYNETPKGLVKTTDPSFVDSIYFSGAGGMVSTVNDYYHFAEMLANGGVYKGKQVVSSKLIHEMETPQLPDTIKGFRPGQTWGLGVRIITSTAAAGGSPLPVGTFGWSGAFGTHFWVDPVNKIIAVYMINVANMRDPRDYTGPKLEEDVMNALEK